MAVMELLFAIMDACILINKENSMEVKRPMEYTSVGCALPVEVRLINRYDDKHQILQQEEAKVFEVDPHTGADGVQHISFPPDSSALRADRRKTQGVRRRNFRC